MEPNENRAFDALSDRVRRRILAVLGEKGELSVNEIVEGVGGVGRTTISSHLRILRASGLVIERRNGRQRCYSVDSEGAVRDAFVYLQSILRNAVDELGSGHASSDEGSHGRDGDREVG